MLTTHCTYSHDWGDIYHYKDGLLHCDDGPAITTAAGYKLWYRDGKLHRNDGPAYIGPCGIKEYWIGGYQYDVHQFVDIMAHRVRDLEDHLASIESSRNCINNYLHKELRTTARLKRRAFAVRKQSLFWRGLANKCADIGVHMMKEMQTEKEPLVLFESKTCLRCKKPVRGTLVYSGITGPYCSNVCAVG
jgi:hypothetical protein